MVHIPYGNPESMKKMQILVDELIQYPSGRTTDTVMAFWFAWRAAQQGLNRMRVVNRLHDGENKAFWRKASKRRTLKNPYYEGVNVA
jgi:tRNA G10  N-methylase Trm11